MPIADRRARDRDAQRRLIVEAARRIAEADGWDAVTTRRLSTEIEYSQPVLYKHFSSMEDLARAVALDGFRELADLLGAARRETPDGQTLERIAGAYFSFAAEKAAVYDAMFTRSTHLGFGTDEAPAPLRAAFAELRATVSAEADDEVDTITEVLWGALHGLATLARNQRLRPGHDAERIRLLVALIGSNGGTSA